MYQLIKYIINADFGELLGIAKVLAMKPKRFHLRLDWKEGETITRKKYWLNRLLVENPELEEYDDYLTQHFEEKALKLVIHHDTESEAIKVLKAFLIAFSKEKDEISYIEISTDVCLDDVEDGLWLISLMPNEDVVLSYSYNANLEHIYKSTIKQNETD